MAGLGRRDDVRVGRAGKLKTATQMAALALLAWAHGRPQTFLCGLGLTLLNIAAVLSVYSGGLLFWRALPALTAAAPAPRPPGDPSPKLAAGARAYT